MLLLVMPPVLLLLKMVGDLEAVAADVANDSDVHQPHQHHQPASRTADGHNGSEWFESNFWNWVRNNSKLVRKNQKSLKLVQLLRTSSKEVSGRHGDVR